MVALVAGNTQVALGTVVGKGKVLTKLSDLQKERRPVMLVDSSGRCMTPRCSLPCRNTIC